MLIKLPSKTFFSFLIYQTLLLGSLSLQGPAFFSWSQPWVVCLLAYAIWVGPRKVLVAFLKLKMLDNFIFATIVWNNTERSLLHFAQVLTMVTSCKTVVLYHNLNTDVDIMHWSYSDFSSFNCSNWYICVGVHVDSYRYLPPQSRYRKFNTTRVPGVTVL